MTEEATMTQEKISPDSVNNPEKKPAPNFIRHIINEDIQTNKHGGNVATRFPPEPNGYLHIGHAKSICLNFGLALEYNGVCYMRFDDTNPSKEDIEYVESIMRDVRWLGFEWGEGNLRHSSDYFDQLYDYAIQLIKRNKAYVCSLSPEEIRTYRGTLTETGKDSPYRNRSIEENLDLFERMRLGEFNEGEQVLRAKINMQSPNINLRDPVIYRIKKMTHHMTGDKWCIYPMYDYTHCLSDMLEGITHSICTLEFEDHRPLYDWVLDELQTPCHPQQIEFARLSLNYTVMSKRKLNELVINRYVNGWTDPRLPTISGLRRRGYTPNAIRDFCERIGVTKSDTCIDMALLETCVREDLNTSAPRAFCVQRPLKLIIDNYPADQVEYMEAPWLTEKPELGVRKIPFTRELFIEQEDFMETPPKGYFRLQPNGEVRLRYGYIIKCISVEKDPITDEILAVHCTYDLETRHGMPQSNRKVKGTIHWLSANHSIPAEVRLYDRLFTVANPDSAGGDYKDHLNADSMIVLKDSRVEPDLATAKPEDHYQFERLGYFCADEFDNNAEHLVFNRTVTLRDTWAKVEKKGK
ncbi:glutamine--tRNA ligase/YqeY domain fusion protein [Beggiatoa leptomitoformis]|uniref:Glutamine--tRNA ligase n=1 Tax=Beggiatoa leptomitoformis TaxID=288004 RepID=A0A2N9YJ08_9GAMM|nr:glutamine--tRNA ligase/YqeY domain fusion protein [Beggiatoa leptomitoformis]ALG69330.2 glutamine--tRNA ligase/YqeY domain fusion protein [Beggiatoa leptomitoformis]AUI70484.2 glutamine--tRNA ligase/YqeY domain fusion protein [Beggiatoa leptomitoformis]